MADVESSLHGTLAAWQYIKRQHKELNCDVVVLGGFAFGLFLPRF